MPEGKLVVVEEQGRLVLCAGAGGRLVHTQIVSATRDLNGYAAPEIRIASLALQQQGVLPEVHGVELWGEFSTDDAQHLSEQLGLPVETKSRPAPNSPALRREASRQLLPRVARDAIRRRRLRSLRWLAVAVIALPIVWWVYGERKKLHALEAEAARIESALNIASDPRQKADQDRIRAEHEQVTAAQARWNALRMALEPRRYPVAHLDGLARCLAAADVVLTRFEMKVADVTVAGTARSAMDAYKYFNAVNKDGPLGVYAWSMLPPTIGSDGSASFEMKGKMR
jgi:Tfp pilus assembly protein PilN